MHQVDNTWLVWGKLEKKVWNEASLGLKMNFSVFFYSKWRENLIKIWLNCEFHFLKAKVSDHSLSFSLLELYHSPKWKDIVRSIMKVQKMTIISVFDPREKITEKSVVFYRQSITDRVISCWKAVICLTGPCNRMLTSNFWGVFRASADHWQNSEHFPKNLWFLSAFPNFKSLSTMTRK